MKRTALFVVILLSGCGGTSEVKGPPCSVSDNGDGTFTISCSDGTSTVISNGQNGKDGKDGVDGANGDDGQNGTSCTVTELQDGAKLISCSDGTSVTIHDGEDGQRGSSCTVVDNGNGTSTVGCEDGTNVVLHDGELCEVTPNEEGDLVIISCPNGYVVEGSATIEGDVTIKDSVTLALIRNYSRITGGLFLDRIRDISLPNLVEVGGSVAIGGSTNIVETVDLHSLTSIAEGPYSGSGNTGLYITGNANLRSVDLSSLQTVGREELPDPPSYLEVRIQDNPLLPACWADALIAQITTIGDVYQSGNDDIATCN